MYYKNQVLPIVETFIYSDKYNDSNYFKQGKDSIFFTILPNIILDYSVTLGRILGTTILGLIISFSLATAYGVKFTLNHMGKVPGDDILVIVLPIILLGFIFKI